MTHTYKVTHDSSAWFNDLPEYRIFRHKDNELTALKSLYTKIEVLDYVNAHTPSFADFIVIWL